VSKQTVPAIEGWFTSGAEPRLIGSRCTGCATYLFPPRSGFCPNPHCSAEAFEDVELSHEGTIWSFTDAQYQPPAPYISSTDPYEPFAIVAVELEKEGIVVLGQVARGLGVNDLEVGMRVKLEIGTLYEDDEAVHEMWAWRPVGAN